MYTFKSPRPVEEIIQEYQEQETKYLNINQCDDRLFMNNYFYRPNVVYQECTKEDIIKTVQHFNLDRIILSGFEVFPKSLTPLFNHFHGTLIISDILPDDMFLNSIKYLEELDITYIDKQINIELLDCLIESILDGKIGRIKIRGVAHNYNLFRDIEYYEELNQLKVNKHVMHFCRRYTIEHEI